jgi:hypothetical protein
MAGLGRRWTVRDHFGNEVYLTHERWEHITDPGNHPEMAAYEEHLKDTIRLGIRKQVSLNPQKYRYMSEFDDLTRDNTHIVAIVLFRFRVGEAGEPVPKNYIVTGYQKEVR